MMDRYETAIDRLLREARERGEFDDLPGTGKPLPGYGGEYVEDWWVQDWIRREGEAGSVLPPTLALRREREDLERQVDRRHTEEDVRRYVAGLNEQIRKARVGLMDGPPTLLPPVDADAVVAGWRKRRRARPVR
jgi:hypothetical protein